MFNRKAICCSDWKFFHNYAIFIKDTCYISDASFNIFRSHH